VKKVSRGTSRPDRPILFKKPLRAAIAANVKNHTRRIVTEQNCTVHPGTFAGLDLSSGRVRRELSAEIRARCTFESGRVRVVTVSPIVRPGDLFWVKANRFTSKAKSEATLQVLHVDARRIQDMTDDDAIREGIEFVEIPKKFANPNWTLRQRFAWLWDDINGAGAWMRNDWVWVYRFALTAPDIAEHLRNSDGATWRERWDKEMAQ
jgi:hypothetical protein